MASVLLVSEDKETFRAIQSCFDSKDRLTQVSKKRDALTILQEKRYDLVFIDLELLRESTEKNGIKKDLEPFRQLFPSIEIVVLSS
jgi:CheY-like chemotaxis protein